jgi:putative SOS response-associated peptidase YedK
MLTRPADDVVAPYHDRMPVVLPAGLVAPWLAGGPADVDRLLTESPVLVPVPRRTDIQPSRTVPRTVVLGQDSLRLFDDGAD